MLGFDFYNKNTIPAWHITGYETVFDMLHSTSTSKATGIDQIPGKILELAPPAITQSITTLFNYLITTESFPSEIYQEIYLITTIQFQSFQQ